jgi:hypothetical protein
MLPEKNGFALPFAASFVALALIAGTIGASAQPKPGGAPGAKPGGAPPAAMARPAAPAMARPAAPAFHPAPAV